MNLEEIKTSFSKLSMTGIAIVFSILATAGGAIYIGITTYNRVIDATQKVENYKPYDDSDLKTSISDTNTKLLERNAELEKENASLRSEVSDTKDRLVNYAESMVKIQDKASDAIALARETKATSDGNVRETNAALMSIREEVKAVKESLESQMQALKKATSNPLGR